MKPVGYFSDDRKEMIRFVPERRARTLEIGCGEGSFLSGLTGIHESWGVEPSQAAQAAKNRLTHVIPTTFDEAEPNLPTRFFDVIVCNDVIEHLPDHVSFLKRVKNYLAPGGMMIGSIPNVRFYKNLFEFLVEKDWHYEDSGILDRTHLSFFTEKSFRRSLELSGFELLRIEGIKPDHRISHSPRETAYLAAARILALVTGGYFSDIRYLQFAFQAVVRDGFS